MRISVDPQTSASVRSWSEYARDVLDRTTTGSDGLPDVDGDLITVFTELLDEWDEIAQTSGEFRWSAELDPPLVVVMTESFHRIVTRLAAAADERGYALSPPEGEAFYRSLVDALLTTLAEVPDQADRAEELRSTWPGLDL